MGIVNAKLKVGEKGLSIIKKWEGLGPEWHRSKRIMTYLCPSGLLTIGYGHTGPDVKWGMEITLQHAEELLKEDLVRAENYVKAFVMVPLNQHQFDALVSFAFNAGVGNFKTSTLVKILNQKTYEGVPAQLKRWTRGSKIDPKTGRKEILPGLVNRRAEEAALWCEP